LKTGDRVLLNATEGFARILGSGTQWGRSGDAGGAC
jgi:hypothetical protein